MSSEPNHCRDFEFPGLKMLSAQEKQACCWYEYLREAYLRGGQVRELITRLTQLVLDDNGRSGPMSACGLAVAVLHDCFGNVKGFPTTAWLDLPAAVRTAHLKGNDTFKAEAGWATCLRLETRTEVPFEAWKAANLKVAPDAVCGWFRIRPGNRKQMKEQFARELDLLINKNPGLLVKDFKGRDTPEAQLNQLGALRLMDSMSVETILAKIDDKQPVGQRRVQYPYKTEEAFRTGRRKALRRLSAIEGWAAETIGKFRPMN